MSLLLQIPIHTDNLLYILLRQSGAEPLLRGHECDGYRHRHTVVGDELKEVAEIVVLAYGHRKIELEVLLHLLHTFVSDGLCHEGLLLCHGNINVVTFDEESFEHGTIGNLHGVLLIDGLDGGIQHARLARARRENEAAAPDDDEGCDEYVENVILHP